MTDQAFGADVSSATKALNDLSTAVRLKVIVRALRKAVTPVRKTMKATAPFRSGATQSAVRSKVKTDKKVGDGFGVVGPFGKVAEERSGKKRSQAYKGRFLEHGTRHMKAQPFIQKSLDKNRSEVETKFDTEVDKAIKYL